MATHDAMRLASIDRRAREWYAAEMSEQPADCACYESHIAALVVLLSDEHERGAQAMRERAAEVARERGHSHAMECRGHEAHTCITLADDIEALPVVEAVS